jgi:L-lactate utilization protein LutB
MAQRPGVYTLGTRLAAKALKAMGGKARIIRRIPFAGGWTDGRDMPAPPGRTFRDQYRQLSRQQRGVRR